MPHQDGDPPSPLTSLSFSDDSSADEDRNDLKGSAPVGGGDFDRDDDGNKGMGSEDEDRYSASGAFLHRAAPPAFA